ncbi:hypothetical protein [Achromobacter sp. PAB15]|uniref:hypothetical protein n=1 Tax=Achromobacter sp. PAB15 TaxID=3233048 RepID=UPI003F909CC6
MNRVLLHVVRHLDRYEWVGVACGVILIAGLTGVLGPTMDAAANNQPGEQRQAAHK